MEAVRKICIHKDTCQDTRKVFAWRHLRRPHKPSAGKDFPFRTRTFMHIVYSVPPGPSKVRGVLISFSGLSPLTSGLSWQRSIVEPFQCSIGDVDVVVLHTGGLLVRRGGGVQAVKQT